MAWFNTPSELEARVSAAVTMAGVTSQLNLQPATALDPITGTPGDSSAEEGIKNAIVGAVENQTHALKISLATTWWSTRLYLIAALAQRLTEVCRILIVEPARAIAEPPAATQAASAGVGAAFPPPAIVPTAKPSIGERLVGQISIGTILLTIEPRVPMLRKFENWLMQRSEGFDDLSAEIWMFPPSPSPPATPDRWLEPAAPRRFRA